MGRKIRNVELLTLARSDSATLGHVGIGIDAIQLSAGSNIFETAISRVNSAPDFHLALNVEGVTTNTANYGGIAFTQGASADTVMASIKAVNTSTDGHVDLSFNTRTASDALIIKADGSVGVNATSSNSAQLHVVADSSHSYSIVTQKGSSSYYFADGVLYANTASAMHLLNQSGPLRFGANNAEIMRMQSGKVGIGTGSTAPTHKLEI